MPGYWVPLSDLKAVRTYSAFLMAGVWVHPQRVAVSHKQQGEICHLLLSSLQHGLPDLHTLEAPSAFPCLDLIMMQNFSRMDLRWREGRGERDTRAE